MAIARPETLPEHLIPLWDELQPQVSPRIGQAGLEALCSAVSRMRRARAKVDAEGEIVADSKGNATPHPALSVEKSAGDQIRAWVAKFGVKT